MANYLYTIINPRPQLIICNCPGGAILAAIYDLSFDFNGYVLVFLNNAFTTLNGVWMKKASMSGKVSKIGILFYNSLFSAVALLIFFNAEHFYMHYSYGTNQITHAVNVKDRPSLRSYLNNIPNFVKDSEVQELKNLLKKMDHSIRETVLQSLNELNTANEEIKELLKHIPFHSNSSINHIITTDQSHNKRQLVHSDTADQHNAVYSSNLHQSNDPMNYEHPITMSSYIHQSVGHSLSEKKQVVDDDIRARLLMSRSPEALTANAIQSTFTKVYDYEGWSNIRFLVLFIMASVMGSVLNYSIFLCTTLNSALTTAVIGCLKNVGTTYFGMIFFSDYKFDMFNFVGVTLSIIGSLYYTYVTLFKGVSGYGGG
jgi:hypothetical protein